MICIAIYAVLVQMVAFTDDIIRSILGVMGYTVLLCFSVERPAKNSASFNLKKSDDFYIFRI